MKNYSFSNITNEDSYATRKSSEYSSLYRHSDLKASEANLKIQEIKKKYDTPSRRERIESLKKSREVELRPREDNAYHQTRHGQAFCSNPLKQSFAVNRLQKSTLRADSQSKQFLNFRANRIDKENEGCFRSNPREEEEAIFSKVREMKESIINNSEYSKSSLHTRNIVPTGRQSEFRSQFEPRVENIDKINSKIKHILSCLNENQRNSRPSRDQAAQEQHNSYKQVSPEFADPRKSYSNIYQNCSKVVQKISIDKEEPLKHSVLQQRKSIQFDDKSKYDQSRMTLEQRMKARDYSVNKIEYTKDYSIQRSFKKEEALRTPIYSRKQNESAGLKQSGSRSHLDSLKRSNAQENLLKSGKKYNDEISRIQKKIQQFEKEKKKLNIQFTPFSLKNRSTSNLHSNTRPERQSVDPRENLKDSSQASRPSLDQRSSSQDYRFKSSLARGSIYQQRIGEILKKSEARNDTEQKDEDFEVRMQQIEVKVQAQTKIANQPSKFDQMALKKRTEAGIQERRRLLHRQQEIIRTDSIKKLVSLLCDQVKMDENLRNLKIWFESTPQSDKYGRVFRVLEKIGLRLSQEQCAKQFNLNQSENNPFFSVQGFDGNFQRLAQAYKISNQHWEGKISRKFDRRSLLEEGFSAQKIDLQRKGFIELQDLVRFLNIQSGTFFRNRDLFLIFKRLGGVDQVSFEGLIGHISAN